MLAAKLRIVLEADGVVVAESDDPALWRELIARLAKSREEIEKDRIKRWRGAVLTNQDRMRVETILSAVAEARGVPVPILLGNRRTPTLASARALAMYLMRVYGGLSFQTIASVFGKHHTSVLAAVEKVEAKREGAAATEIARLLDVLKASAIG
jgi:chromosomal replication initiation ATPase DnaA